jgi:hypothetical protein
LSWHEDFVRVAGEIVGVEVETSDHPDKIDHVWIDVRAGDDGPLRLSLSTCSRQSRTAGFDPRVWVGTVISTWSELPATGIYKTPPLSYSAIESRHVVDYAPYDRPALETLLLEKAGNAIFVEAWGDLYVRGNVGLHQIHSRRASFAVPIDYLGRDGALQFYYREPAVRETLLFKFAGQQ